jgi:YYY domain-containing protein
LGEVPGLHTLVRQRVLVDPQLLGPAPDPAQPGIVARAASALPVSAAVGLLARAALASPVWTAMGLTALAVTVVLVLRRSIETGAKVRDFVVLLMGVATLLVLSVEFVYVRDHCGTRMNTIFKFYFQAWVLWAVAGAFAIVSLTRRGLAAKIGVLAAVAPLIAAGLLFPALAIPRRAVEYGAPPTLDGADHLARSQTSDFLAIDWLNQHVDGAPVILEAPGGGYEYEGRVSAHTGLPTVLGWAGHEWQWRGSLDEQNARKPDIETVYSSTRPDEVLTLLDKYDISYVYVGPVERGRYPAEGLAKFETLMQIAYQNEDVTIYVR